MSCPLCRERKGKRQCPAKGERICAACCGSKRRVEIDCPSDCVWLGAHAGAWAGRETERLRDHRRLAPHVASLSEPQLRLLLVGFVGFDRLRVERRPLSDRLALDAVRALRKTVETRGHGVLYDHAAEDLRAEGLLHDLRGLFEAKDAEGRPSAPDDRDLLPALRALETIVEDALEEGGGDEFLAMAGRVAAELRRDAQPEQRRRIVEP